MHASGGVGSSCKSRSARPEFRVQRGQRVCHRRHRAAHGIMAIRAGECDTGLAVGVERLSGAGLLAGARERRRCELDAERSLRCHRRDRRAGGHRDQCRASSPRSAWSTATATAGRASSCSPASRRRTTPTPPNPLAAYSKRFTLERSMGDLMIAYPNTRRCARPTATARPPRCCVSGAKLKTLSLEQQRRAVKVSASVLTSDPGRRAARCSPIVNTLTRNAASQAYELAGVGRGSRSRRAARLLRHR